MVRCHLEHAYSVWNPYCIQAIKALEVWNKLDEGNQDIMFTKKNKSIVDA